MAEISDLTIRLLERKSNTVLADVSNAFRSLTWTERFRRFGTGVLRMRSEDVPTAARTAATTGNLAIFAKREWVDDAGLTHIDVVHGPLTSFKWFDGGFISYRLGFDLVNEIVVLGSGEAAARNVTRRFDATTQAALGLREITFDARQTANLAEREAAGDAELAKRLEVAEEIEAGGDRDAAGPTVDLGFADDLIYFNHRVVDTDGVANIDPGTVLASQYIRTLIASELTAPTLGRRVIDVPATVITPGSEFGTSLMLPVRWPILANAIEDAGVAGGIGVQAPLNEATGQVEFQARPEVDRRVGKPNAALINPEFAQQEYDVRPGDRVTIELYFDDVVLNPDKTFELLCVARTITVKPKGSDTIRLQWGKEKRTNAQIFRAQGQQAEPAKVV